ALEEAVHEIIFPLRATSDDVRPEQMNLWVIDERLAYHHYLASDKRFDKITDVIESESATRADLVIFHTTSAFVDSAPPFGAVTLIEFKRPARTGYTVDQNPIQQVIDYVKDIR